MVFIMLIDNKIHKILHFQKRQKRKKKTKKFNKKKDIFVKNAHILMIQILKYVLNVDDLKVRRFYKLEK